MLPAAIGVAKSSNGKTGPIRVTHRAQGSCSNSCPFKDGGGCYAESGPQAWTTRRLNRAEPRSPEAYALENAAAIDALPARGVPLRVDIVGDDTTPKAAQITGAAAARYLARGGGPAWKYTHSWRDIPRNAWGPSLSILASCETIPAALEALELGYAPALVVERFQQSTTYSLAPNLRGIPCPAQTGAAENCDRCRLCTRADTLQQQGLAILFAAHAERDKAIATLRRAS